MRSIILLFVTAIAAAQTPTLVHVSSGENSRAVQFYSALDYYVNYAEPTIAGNCAGVFVFWNNSNSPSVTVSDDAGDMYGSPVAQVIGASYAAAVWVAPNVTSGAHQLDLHFNAPTSDIVPITFEEAECATSSPVDVASGQESSGTSISAGSLTPNSPGEMLLQFAAFENNGVPATSSMTAGSQPDITWNLEIAELLDGTGMQSGIYNSTSAINPTFSTGKSNTYISIAIALETANSGGVPSGMHVISEQHVSMFSTADGGPGYADPSVTQFPCAGNLVVVMANGGSPITSIAENGADLSYAPLGTTYPATYIGTGASESEQVFFATNHSCNNGNTFTITPDLTYTGNGVDYDYTLVFYDVAAASSSPYDTASTSSGEVTSCSAPCNLTGPTLTPSDGNEMIFNMSSEWYNQVSGISGGGISDTYYILSTESGPENPAVDQDNGWAHYYTTSTSSYSVTWTYTSTTQVQGYWAAVAAGFQGGLCVVVDATICGAQGK